MYVLDSEWDDGFLDYTCNPAQVRIRPSVWYCLGAVDEAFVIPKRSWRTVYNYLREIGLVHVWRKIKSRSSERLRNKKFVSCGLGEVVESKESRYSVGEQVVFLATFHPRCTSSVVVSDTFVRLCNDRFTHTHTADGTIYFFDKTFDSSFPAGWKRWAGWSPYSGSTIQADEVRTFLRTAERVISRSVAPPAMQLPCHNRPIRTRVAQRPGNEADYLKGVLFGYSNYAKTNILPNISRAIRIETIHEIDPTQIGKVSSFAYGTCTNPELEEKESADVCFIASYHHTHVPLAIRALKQGAYAVVEKPLATTREQLDRLVPVLRQHPARLFVCYHKRYAPFNAWISQDLGVSGGEPISSHCIVYEIPLPRLYWYNWPNSGSRIVSNGCHWIDHFLFINQYAPVSSSAVWRSPEGEYIVRMRLENGASFFMALTDKGSGRIGVQEHVELRANGATATISNGRRYIAENGSRYVRRKSISKLQVYGAMYREITRRVVAGLPGDTWASITRSATAILDLEEQVNPVREAALKRFSGLDVDGAVPAPEPGQAAFTGRPRRA